MNSPNKTKAETTPDDNKVFWKQYNKSINCLQSSLKSGSVASTWICCVLFICLENFYCKYDKALANLQSGLIILKKWRKEDIKSASVFKSAREYTQVFRRFDLQTTTSRLRSKSVGRFVSWGYIRTDEPTTDIKLRSTDRLTKFDR